jgi:hypothetical protein
MKRTIATFALALTFGTMPALAQRSVTVAWTASSDAAVNPSLTYNVYRASIAAVPPPSNRQATCEHGARSSDGYAAWRRARRERRRRPKVPNANFVLRVASGT